MKLTIFSDYSDNIAETKEFLYRSKTAVGITESELLDDEIDLLKKLHKLIIDRAREIKVTPKEL